MKKMILPACLILISCIGFAQNWEKSGDRTWTGPINKYYKLDENCALHASVDTVSWSLSNEGMWQDVEGKWYKINNKTLAWSTDGINWKPSPDGKWTGSDGNTYKLEENCLLKVMKNSSLGRADIKREKSEYREKINKRLQELDNRIARLKVELKNDTTLNTSILKIERTRDLLKTKLDELGTKAERSWSEFRKDVDRTLESNSLK